VAESYRGGEVTAVKFLHCADIHLDSPLQGLAKHQGAFAEGVRIATRTTFANVVDIALRESVDFVLIAGDLYDTGLQGFESVLFFNSEMARLQKAGIRAFLVHGNHDAASKLTRNLRPPTNVRVFQHKHPETAIDEQLGIAIHGQSFGRPTVVDDLASAYPMPVPGLFNIGLLHTNVNGNPNHDNYAPCSLDILINKGYDYWALGHVHARQVVHQAPPVVYPGNTQGRQIRETGPKSCELVTVEGHDVTESQAVEVCAVPWYSVVVDASEATTSDEVCNWVQVELASVCQKAAGRMAAVRVSLRGATKAHAQIAADEEKLRNEVLSAASEVGGGQLWIERVVVATAPQLDVDQLLVRQDPVGEVLRILRSLAGDPRATAALAERLRELRKKLPSEVTSGPDALTLDEKHVGRVLGDVERSLLSWLSEMEMQ